MAQETSKTGHKVYKLVLTGGPCGGKTTGQARLSTFFENLGWKVYRVPESACVLMSGGVKWTELSEETAYVFQYNLVKTMMAMENTFFSLAEDAEKNCIIICDRGVMDASASYNFQADLLKTMMTIEDTYSRLAESSKHDCIIICDRGTMDASAYLKPGQWERMKKEYNWNEIELRDSRYNQIIHMVSAAKGAAEFYTTEEHATRYEGLEQAIFLDDLASQAWVGHPYYDVIDNKTGFEQKLMKMISAVAYRLGIDVKDRLNINSKKRKFLIASLPDKEVFPQFQDFTVVHDYLVTPSRKMQARVRRRGQNGHWTYTHTIRRPEIHNQVVELKMQTSGRDYQILLAQRDDKHYTVYKKRRCFLWNNNYYQLDIYEEPCHPKCKDLVILETYTAETGIFHVPEFLEISRELTGDSEYSMFNLSLKEQYSHMKHFVDCRSLSVDYVDERDICKIQKIIASSPSAEDGKVADDQFTFGSPKK